MAILAMFVTQKMSLKYPKVLYIWRLVYHFCEQGQYVSVFLSASKGGLAVKLQPRNTSFKINL